MFHFTALMSRPNHHPMNYVAIHTYYATYTQTVIAIFCVNSGGGDEDIFGAAVEDVDASEIAGGGDDDMFGAAVDVEEVNADVTATDDVDDMFGAPAAVDEQPAYDIQADPTPEPEAVAEPEPEPVQQESARIVWSRKFRAIIDERATEERKLLLARREKAAAELKEYNERREEHKSSTAARNRQEEADFLINIAEEKDNDNPWSRVVNMVRNTYDVA